jgi:hypothetical protein
MTLTWLGSQFSPQAPGFWLLVSLLVTALLASARPYLPIRHYRLLWIGHWLLLPYLGMLLGSLSPRLLGLTGIDWLAGLSLGLGLFFAVVVILVLVRATVDLSDPATGVSGPTAAPSNGWRAAGDALLASGATEFHWVFLRGAIWEIFLSRPESLALPGYWAVWGAALIAAGEILALRPSFIPWLLQMTTLLVTSILFFYTRNFWLCWMMHNAIQLIGSPSTPLPRRWSARLQGQRR